jgi:hypothetical protein
MIKTILLDMDDVLVDFTGAYCKLIGVDERAVRAAWTPATGWHMGTALTTVMRLHAPLSLEQFWAPLQGDVEFWEKLQPLPWFHDLIAMVYQFTDDIWVVSSPSECDSSYTGKVRWLKRVFGRSFTHFHLTPHKERLATPGSVLIDDREETVVKFQNACSRIHAGRSYGITFPQNYNSLYALTGTPKQRLDYVRRSLAAI